MPVSRAEHGNLQRGHLLRDRSALDKHMACAHGLLGFKSWPSQEEPTRKDSKTDEAT